LFLPQTLFARQLILYGVEARDVQGFVVCAMLWKLRASRQNSEGITKNKRVTPPDSFVSQINKREIPINNLEIADNKIVFVESEIETIENKIIFDKNKIEILKSKTISTENKIAS
jgi:hypothetical protein